VLARRGRKGEGSVAPLFYDYSLRRGKNLFLDLTVFSMLPRATNPTMKRLAQPACLLLGLMFFLRTVRLHTPRVRTHFNNGDEWSGAFTALAMAGASFLLPLFPART